MAEYQRISISLLQENRGQIEGLPANPRQWTRTDLDRLEKSIKETPELLDARGCIVVPHEGRYVILGGNMRLSACRELGMKDIPCYVLPEGTPAEKLKEIVIKDNGSFGAWDFDMLADAWDGLDLSDWGVQVPQEWQAAASSSETSEADEIERKRKEFEERIKAGEISEEDEEYQAFLDKFKLKKTTDDCYTPSVVYEAVASYVVKRYGVKERDFVRPFYPGGDYRNENYPKGCVVVDNPPFSILSEILAFYAEKGIKFFLFAPTLTLFSSSSSSCTALPIAAAVTYENGAQVNTSFLTNLEPKGVRLRSCPELYGAVKTANDDNLRAMRKEMPKYSYDHHVVTSTFVGALSRLGIKFSVPVEESTPISALDAQKEPGKAIYGKGYLVSEQVFAEREKAEREKAERWELSDRELAIVAKLSEAGRKRRKEINQ